MKSCCRDGVLPISCGIFAAQPFVTVAAVFIARVVAQRDLDNQKPLPWRGRRCVAGVRGRFHIVMGGGRYVAYRVVAVCE